MERLAKLMEVNTAFPLRETILTVTLTVWRIVVGVSLVPAFATLYQRLTLPEAKRYEDAHQNADLHSDDSLENLKKEKEGVTVDTEAVDNSALHARQIADNKKGHFAGALYAVFSRESTY